MEATERGDTVADYTIPHGTTDWDTPLNDNLSDINDRLTTNESSISSLSTEVSGSLQKNANLSDLSDVSASRNNLGLGNSATLDVGTTAGTVMAGDDSRITSALQSANNLSDLASASTARTNLGLGGAATLNVGTTTGTVAAGDDSRITGALQTTGGTMSGAIAMGSHKITGLTNGSAASDAAAFGQIPTAGTGSTNFVAGNDNRVNTGYNNGSPIQGFLSWNYDPQAATSSNSLTAGTIFLHKIWLPSGTITNIGFGVNNTPSGLTSGQNFAGIYNLSGTRLAQTADQTTNWAGTGPTFKTCALSSPLTVATAGFHYVALLCNASTTVAAGASSNSTQQYFNGNTSAGSFRHCTFNTGGQTTLPSTIALASTSSTGASIWVTVW